MYQIQLTKPCTAYFIGIGGISMSGFAELLHDAGFTVKGSDANRSKITEHLQSLGVEVLYGQKSNNITSDIDFVVYTAVFIRTIPNFAPPKKWDFL